MGFWGLHQQTLCHYSMNDWWKKKRMHKYDDMYFSLLDNELGEDFYKSKIRFNPTLKPPSQMFMEMLQHWIENIDLATMRMKVILLDMHYKYAFLLAMGELKVVVDGDPSTTKLLMDNVPSIMAIVLTTWRLFKKLVAWKGANSNASSWAFSIIRSTSNLLFVCVIKMPLCICLPQYTNTIFCWRFI